MTTEVTAKNTEQLGGDQKLGLALSGGGFRASFFHIGVLAQMAYQGLLRRVEVISAVSGGSIIGALYYLHVKKLLEKKADNAINDQDYVDIVKKIEKDFLESVQCNLRMMTYCDWKKNLQMASPDYSRSDRLGELYDEYLYRPVLKLSPEDMILMSELKIFPKRPDGENDKAFNPRRDNAARKKAKVPILLINATTLNNGHVWRFEASTMGEPRADDEISLDVDKSIRLSRPPSYSSMTECQRDMRLGHAVAASACVPGIFNPMAISGLYPDIRIQLVDGGVYDNQGIHGLIDVEDCCNLMIVSDGSGQMLDDDHPPAWLAAVLSRSQEVSMKRVRGEQLSSVLRDFRGRVAFSHLREGISPRVAYWNTEAGKTAQSSGSMAPSECRRFGVSEEVQDLLSKIRTDLDSFTDVEAYSLMLDGYLVGKYALSRTEGFKGLLRSSEERDTHEWEFMKIKPWIEQPTPIYLRHLRAAHSRFFKVFKLNTPLAAGALALLAVFVYLFFKSPLADVEINITVRAALITTIIAGTGLLLPQLTRTFEVFEALKRPTRRLASLLGEAVVPILGSVLVRFHLRFIDRLFIRMGKLESLDRQK